MELVIGLNVSRLNSFVLLIWFHRSFILSNVVFFIDPIDLIYICVVTFPPLVIRHLLQHFRDDLVACGLFPLVCWFVLI